MSDVHLDRRRFLKITAGGALGSGLILSVNWTNLSAKEPMLNANDEFQANAWIKIGLNGQVTLYTVESEMGQGPFTLMSMILAEELEVEWQDIIVEKAPLTDTYGRQVTGGSSSIRKGWSNLRKAGAAVRQMLIQAAALTWSLKPEDCYAQNSVVLNKHTNKQLHFSELVTLASSLELPNKVRLKSPDEYKVIGQAYPRKDLPEKINGSAQFGMDIKLENMLYATTVHCPVLGGRVKSINASQADSLPGVFKIFSIKSAVAVVAKDTWTAFKAAAMLDVEWNEGKNKDLTSDKINIKLEQYARLQSQTVYQRGKIDQSDISSQSLEASYTLALQAHTTMEPMNCTARVTDERCEIWVPTQAPSDAKKMAQKYGLSTSNFYLDKISRQLDLSNDDAVKVHTTYLGGGFGRRVQQDFVIESVKISKEIKRPVQLVWTREQDVQHDFYHPQTFHKLEGRVNKNGKPLSWWHRLAGIGNAKASDLPYAIPNVKIDVADVAIAVPTGPWRSVFQHYYAFAQETFFDELAYLGKQDPLELRLELISDTRLKHVLELAAENSSYAKPQQEGHFIGIAAHKSFGTYVAEAVEISLHDDGEIKVHRVVVAVDCGIVINPDILRAQMESSVVFALSAALKTSITIDQGKIQESNFHDVPVLRMHEMPIVDTFIVKNNLSPQGIGEPAVPPLAPALANAIFKATGKPVRSLPIRLNT